jgi:desulfoferrodoxin (superoxide reductase-like protein)
MKRFALVSLALCVVLVAGSVWAHPPKDVKIEFDPTSKMLMVTAAHDTKDPTKHFIGTVEVDLNGEKIIEQKFKSQISADAQQAHYWINDAEVGDTLVVTATCNIAGKKKVTLEIAKPAEPAKTK